MIGRDAVFEIYRMHDGGSSIRRISQKLGISRKTVAKYLKDPMPNPLKKERFGKLEPYKDEIGRLLEKEAGVSSVVIKQKIDAMGFDGSITIIKDYLQKIRPKRPKEPFIRFESRPGEQMQADWGHFGTLVYEGARRKLYALAVIECHSRMLYVEFTHSQKQESLHHGLLNAFVFFGGCPRELVVDNMLTAVTERSGSLIRFNDRFLDFLLPFKVAPRACNIRAPHEKGKIENSIRYIRRNFWPLRSFADLKDVQGQAMHWLKTVANVRIHQTTGEVPKERLKKSALKPLPENLPDTRETVSVKVHTDFAVRFDANVYTVPPWAVGKQATLKADPNSVTVYWRDKKLATHPRCYAKKKRIETEYHRQQVKKLRNKLFQNKDIRIFSSLGPEAVAYLESMLDANLPIKKNISRLLNLKDEYGGASVVFAMKKAATHNAFGADYVENILYQEMTPQTKYPPVKLKDESLNRIRLKEPRLVEYDAHILKTRKHIK